MLTLGTGCPLLLQSCSTMADDKHTPSAGLTDPPRRRYGPQVIEWDEVMQLARANPGEWVRVPVPVSVTLPNSIKRGQYRIDPDEIEMTTAREDQPRGRCFLYLRTRTDG